MSREVVRSYRVMRIVGVLVGIQAVQLVNIVPLFIDPRPDFMLGLVMNFIAGVLATIVAYFVWTGRKYGWLIATLFGIFALIGATYFGHLVSVHFGVPFFLQPLSMPSIMMTVNLALIILLLYARLGERPQTAMDR